MSPVGVESGELHAPETTAALFEALRENVAPALESDRTGSDRIELGQIESNWVGPVFGCSPR